MSSSSSSAALFDAVFGNGTGTGTTSRTSFFYLPPMSEKDVPQMLLSKNIIATEVRKLLDLNLNVEREELAHKAAV